MSIRPIVVATILLSATWTTAPVWAQQTAAQPSDTQSSDTQQADQDTVRSDDITDEEALRQLEQKFADAFIAKDLDAIMALYNPYVLVYDVVPPRQYVGLANYRKDWEDYLGSIDGTPKFQIDNLAITVEGNLGFSTSIQKVSGTDTKGQPFDFAFRVTDVYRKTNNGEWQIVHEHVSVPVNLETNTPDLSSKE